MGGVTGISLHHLQRINKLKRANVAGSKFLAGGDSDTDSGEVGVNNYFVNPRSAM